MNVNPDVQDKIGKQLERIKEKMIYLACQWLYAKENSFLQE